MEYDENLINSLLEQIKIRSNHVKHDGVDPVLFEFMSAAERAWPGYNEFKNTFGDFENYQDHLRVAILDRIEQLKPGQSDPILMNFLSVGQEIWPGLKEVRENFGRFNQSKIRFSRDRTGARGDRLGLAIGIIFNSRDDFELTQFALDTLRYADLEPACRRMMMKRAEARRARGNHPQ